MPDVHYFGIRHHGPGSARRLCKALDALQPACVLIEGPADCTELLPLLAHTQMEPPVALLAYTAGDAQHSIYFPFAEYSPEYQATCWAVRHQAELQFIDVPVAQQLAQAVSEDYSDDDVDAADSEAARGEANDVDDGTTAERFSRDPIAALAELAGYHDGEAWWNDLIEQNTDADTSVFEVVHQAMAALRAQTQEQTRNLQREAHMRLAISKTAKSVDGPVAVVCGAWHVPALQATHTQKADRELVRQLPTKLAASKYRSTWIPWTSPRLATASGYGAGVAAPMWYQHLWQQQSKQQADTQGLDLWLAQVAQALRETGQVISTAAVIEAVRLSHSLAAVRKRPTPGFEEAREAVLACMCDGEEALWLQVEARLLLGAAVGRIPDDAPLAPLLEDLQKQQKRLGLKPEALTGELSLDLRSERGLGRSVLLHRLRMLDVPWGEPSHSGSSRGTFRERWEMYWRPEYAVQLVENLIYGSTIEQAATRRISEAMTAAVELAPLAQSVQTCLEAQLLEAADVGLSCLTERAALTADGLQLLSALSPLVDLHRYGTAREMSLARVGELVEQLAVRSSLALPYAARNLDDAAAVLFSDQLRAAHQALQLAELPEPVSAQWWQTLDELAVHSATTLQVAGLAAQLLYVGEQMDSDNLQRLLGRALSPATAASDAARYFEGFFAGAAQRLLYDDLLREAVEQWLMGLEESDFVHYLPLFRRVFAELDAMERKRLIDTVLRGRTGTQQTQTLDTKLLPQWQAHLGRLQKLLNREQTWTS